MRNPNKACGKQLHIKIRQLDNCCGSNTWSSRSKKLNLTLLLAGTNRKEEGMFSIFRKRDVEFIPACLLLLFCAWMMRYLSCIKGGGKEYL